MSASELPGSAVATQIATPITSAPPASYQPHGTQEQRGLHAPQTYLVDVVPGYTNPLVPPFNRTWAIVKNVIGGIIVALAIAGLGMSACGVYYSVKINEWYAQNVLLACTLSLTIVSILWQISDFGTQQVRGIQKPIHPGFHVAIHLLLVLCMAAVGAALNIYYPEWMLYTNSYDYSRFSSYEYFYKYDTRLRKLGFGCIVVLWLLESAHFVLFVGACVDTHRCRRFNSLKHLQAVTNGSQLASVQVPAGYALVPNSMVGPDGTYQPKAL